MTARGLFLAVDDQTIKVIRAIKGDPLRRQFMGDLEEHIPEQRRQGTDKAWRMMQSMFWGFTNQDYAGGLTNHDFHLLSSLFYRATSLHKGEMYVINWVKKDELLSYVDVLNRVDEVNFRQRYYDQNKGLNGPVYELSESQLTYTYNWFLQIRQFVNDVKRQSLHLIFTVDN